MWPPLQVLAHPVYGAAVHNEASVAVEGCALGGTLSDSVRSHHMCMCMYSHHMLRARGDALRLGALPPRHAPAATPPPARRATAL